MVRWYIVKEGGIQPLLRFLDNAIDPRRQEVCMGALRNLAACSANTEALISAGFLPRLVGVLQSGVVTVQQIAAASVCYMASSSETRRLLGIAGAIPPLVKLLGAKTCTAQEYAAQVLCWLIANPEIHKSEMWLKRLAHHHSVPIL
jgi:vacuolar protein 8